MADASPVAGVFTALTTGVISAVNDAVTAVGGVMPAVITVLGLTIGVGLIIKFVRRNAKG